MNNKFASKKRAYDVSQEAKRQIMKLRGEVETNKPQMDAWDRLLRTETRGTFLEHWKNAAKNFSGKELTKSSRSWINYSEGPWQGGVAAIQPSDYVICRHLQGDANRVDGGWRQRCQRCSWTH